MKYRVTATIKFDLDAGTGTQAQIEASKLVNRMVELIQHLDPQSSSARIREIKDRCRHPLSVLESCCANGLGDREYYHVTDAYCGRCGKKDIPLKADLRKKLEAKTFKTREELDKEWATE